MKIKTVLTTSIVTASFLAFAFPAFGATEINIRQNINSKSEVRQEIKQEIKTEVKNELKMGTGSGRVVPTGMKDKIKEIINKRMIMDTMKLTGINGTSLTVEKDGASLTVNTGKFDKCTTVLKRRFFGDSSLSEFSVGDILNIVGYYTDDTKTVLNACHIRNVSIQKRFGVFMGDVKSISDTGFVMTTFLDNRADQTVTLSSTSKLITRKGESMPKSDLVVGHKVRVRGLWDRTNNTITEVSIVKDFSIPVLPTMTPRGLTPSAERSSL